MGVILELARAKNRITELEAELSKLQLPGAPEQIGVITSSNLRSLLTGAGLKDIKLGNYDYKLCSIEEGRIFLSWYRDLHPYIHDGYDCNVFALEQCAAAATWMNGEYVWGIEWAAGLDPSYQFFSHGFNFAVFGPEPKLYFCDELEVAAPKDDFIEAYEVDSYLTVV